MAGKAAVVVDGPEKVKIPVLGGNRVLAEDVLTRIRDATHDVILISSYLVPEDHGARVFQDLAKRDIRVRIVTNSSGPANHAYVHAGYRPHGEALLRAGV